MAYSISAQLGMLWLFIQQFYSEALFTACALLWDQTFGFRYKLSHIPVSEKQMVSRKKLGLVPPSASFTEVILGLSSQYLLINNHQLIGCTLSSYETLESISFFFLATFLKLPTPNLFKYPHHKHNYFSYHYPPLNSLVLPH